jgi:hypothetical protein
MFVINVVAVISNSYVVTVNKKPNNGIFRHYTNYRVPLNSCFIPRVEITALGHSDSGNPLICNFQVSFTTNLSIRRIVECAWHRQLWFGNLAPDGNFHEAHYCDKKACSLSKMYVLARFVLHYYRACFVTKLLSFVPCKGVLYTYIIYIYIYIYIRITCITQHYIRIINVRSYMHPKWKPLHPLCSWSGYGPGLT